MGTEREIRCYWHACPMLKLLCKKDTKLFYGEFVDNDTQYCKSCNFLIYLSGFVTGDSLYFQIIEALLHLKQTKRNEISDQVVKSKLNDTVAPCDGTRGSTVIC